eukprot:c5210_g2_i1 orf=2-169(-)
MNSRKKKTFLHLQDIENTSSQVSPTINLLCIMTNKPLSLFLKYTDTPMAYSCGIGN